MMNVETIKAVLVKTTQQETQSINELETAVHNFCGEKL